MSTTRRLAVLDAIVTRLEAITKAGGFETDLGRTVLVGEAVALGPDDPESALAVVVGETTLIGLSTGEHVGEILPVRLAVLVKVRTFQDYRRAWRLVELGLGDVKRAMELEDRTLGGLVRGEIRRGPTQTLEREEGTLSIGAAITYEVPYATPWGHP